MINLTLWPLSVLNRHYGMSLGINVLLLENLTCILKRDAQRLDEA